jgi:hypothetical protein
MTTELLHHHHECAFECVHYLNHKIFCTCECHLNEPNNVTKTTARLYENATLETIGPGIWISLINNPLKRRKRRRRAVAAAAAIHSGRSSSSRMLMESKGR